MHRLFLSVALLWLASSGSVAAQTPARGAEYLAGLRAGFEEVSDDFDGWIASWTDSTATAAYQWGARVVVLYSTEPEIVDLYRFRASSFSKVRHNPAIAALCAPNALTGPVPDVSELDLGPVMTLTGRGFARLHVGAPAWKSPVDLTTDVDAWTALGAYLAEVGLAQTAMVLGSTLQGSPASAEEMCLMQADLYGRAASHPKDMVGSTRLIDFIRAIDALGAS